MMVWWWSDDGGVTLVWWWCDAGVMVVWWWWRWWPLLLFCPLISCSRIDSWQLAIPRLLISDFFTGQINTLSFSGSTAKTHHPPGLNKLAVRSENIKYWHLARRSSLVLVLVLVQRPTSWSYVLVYTVCWLVSTQACIVSLELSSHCALP